ncbi:MAG: hypothetical protein AOA66_1740 [Candidatus Bathyarchaeota archaeon BA2]|nr:MAG: hypothetical protein AOA66_1740 [Candidatus Bathyarchaeota archaeon BA2]
MTDKKAKVSWENNLSTEEFRLDVELVVKISEFIPEPTILNIFHKVNTN